MKTLYPTPFGDFYVDRSRNHKLAQLLEKNVFNQEEVVLTLEKLIKKGDVFYDIGANLGLVSIPLARVAGEVHSFEPIPENLENLRENVLQNKATNITIHPFALGSKAARAGATMRTPGSTGTFTLTEGNDFEIKTLDTLNDLPAPQLIKIDVEGMEPHVLQGAEKVIRKHRPIILFEVNIGELRKHHEAPLSELRKSLEGYGLYLPIQGKLLPITSLGCITLLHEPRAFLFNQPGGVFDLIAIPEGKTVDLPLHSKPLLKLFQIAIKKVLGKITRNRYSW